MKKKWLGALIAVSLVSLVLNLYKKDISPPSFTADEAAFGYNAYSIAQTGKDEYGTFLPLRLKSFGDYKLPLYSYLSVPFISFFGLSETTTRMLNIVLTVLFPFAMFALVKELFDKEKLAVFSALVAGLSWGLLSISRQAHEAYLCLFFTTIALWFFIKLTKKVTVKDTFGFASSVLLLLFSYQSGRIFGLLFFLLSLIYFLKKKGGEKIIALIFCVLLFFGATDLIYQPKRVGNLLFFNTAGFELKINEFRAEGGSRLFYNKLTAAKKEFIKSYAKYFSPQFLFIEGDENPRFGFTDMGPITAIEYLFLFVGLYYLFKKKEKYRYLLVIFLLVSPIPAALSWAGVSLTRSLFFLVPVLIISVYGMWNLYYVLPKKYALFFTVALIIAEASSLFYTWDFYLNHYPKRPLVQKGWETGNREMASYVKENYGKYSRFYITRKNGQPYIFLLFYMKYDPTKYQAQATLSSPDQYGFGQVEKFDRFIFSTNAGVNKNSVVIGYPDDFNNINVDRSKIEKITDNNREIFWVIKPK